MERGEIRVIACQSGRVFATRIVEALQGLLASEPAKPEETRLVRSQEIHFANGEIKTLIHDPVRGADVYVVQAMGDPLSDRSVNDNLLALAATLGAAHEADADHITAVLPQFPYSRQERKREREAIMAKQVARFLEISGAHRVLTLDIHAPAICGFFENARLDNLYASGPILNHFREHHGTQNLVVVSPDVGSAERARYYSKALRTELAIVDKERDYSKANTVFASRLVGSVEGRNVFMVDDLIDTAGTVVAAVELLKRNACEDVFLACSFPFLNGPAVERLESAHGKGLFKVLIGTDAVYRGPDFARRHPWYEEVSVAPLFARAIVNVNRKRSVSQLLAER